MLLLLHQRMVLGSLTLLLLLAQQGGGGGPQQVDLLWQRRNLVDVGLETEADGHNPVANILT